VKFTAADNAVALKTDDTAAVETSFRIGTCCVTAADAQRTFVDICARKHQQHFNNAAVCSLKENFLIVL